MPPQGQALKWAEVLCCPICVKVFSRHKQAVNLHCSHAVCLECLANKMDGEHFCSVDKISGDLPLAVLPRNRAIMRIVGVDTQRGLAAFIDHDDSLGTQDRFLMDNIDDSLCAMAAHLRKADSERGGSIYSEVLSRMVQRKIVHLICLQLAEPSGRLRAARQARQIAERILQEVVAGSQPAHTVSHALWTAVRARGCQFLGPDVQELVLNLIILAMGRDALISRKTLVQYVLLQLKTRYPQASKTCVGHVVQLLYRASCFKLVKRDGDSSLMQLKEEFREYKDLRREHDAQIIGIALEAGIRLPPEQWSSLLYGDQLRRSEMQSIIDKLQSPATLTNGIEDLRKVTQGDALMEATVEALRVVDEMTAEIQEDNSLTTVEWRRLRKILEAVRELVDKYADVTAKRNEERADFKKAAVREGAGKAAAGAAARDAIRPIAMDAERAANLSAASLSMFKTRWCRDLPRCARGTRCSYAHNADELRTPGGLSRPHGATGALTSMIPPEGLPSGSRWPFAAPPAPPPPLHPQPHHYMQPPQPPLLLRQQQYHQQQQQALQMQQHQQQQQMHWQPLQPQQQPPQVSWLPSSEMKLQQAAQQQRQPPPLLQGLHAGAVYWEPQQLPTQKLGFSAPSELSEMEQLHMRREEIINRLGPLSLEQDDMLNGPASTSGGGPDSASGDDAHVAYTCASSVLLDDRISDLAQANAASTSRIIELPPMPPGYTPVINSTTTSEETLGALSELALVDAAGAASSASLKARTASLTTTTTTTVRTVCPAPYSAFTMGGDGGGSQPATVQADCSTMHVRDTISEPVATPVIVPSASVVLYAPAACDAPGAVVAANGAVVAPSGAVLTLSPPYAARDFEGRYAPDAYETTSASLAAEAARLPVVYQPLSQINPVQAQEDPQDVVSCSLDRIVDVRERLTDADGRTASTVVKTQLEVELEIASRQIEQLDPLTTQNCLLKELEAVERKIEEIESSSSNATEQPQPVQMQQQMQQGQPMQQMQQVQSGQPVQQVQQPQQVHMYHYPPGPMNPPHGMQ